VRVGRRFISGRGGRDSPPHPRFHSTFYTSPLGHPLPSLRKPASHIGSAYHTLYEKRLLSKVDKHFAVYHEDPGGHPGRAARWCTNRPPALIRAT
jgi:hypothetical protein